MHPVLFHAGPVLLPTYGAVMALGLLAALALALRTARQQGLDSNRIWNLSILALFLGAVAAKLWILIVHFPAFRVAPLLLLNLSALGSGPQALVAACVAVAVVLVYTRRAHMPLRATLDALSAPLLLLLGIENLGCMLAGCAYGSPSSSRFWSVTFHSAYAFVWWGTPLGRALHPVQALGCALLVLLSAFAFWMGTWGIRSGRVAAWSILCGALVEFLLQFWRGDVAGWSVLPWLTPVQTACLLLMGLTIPLLWDPAAWRYDRGRSPVQA